MILLIVAAGFKRARAYGLGLIADDMAVYAYYALVAGVLLQLVSYLRYREKD